MRTSERQNGIGERDHASGSGRARASASLAVHQPSHALRPGLRRSRRGGWASTGRRQPRGGGRGAGEAAGKPEHDHRDASQGQGDGGKAPVPAGTPGPESARAPFRADRRPPPPRSRRLDGVDQHPAPRRLRTTGRSPPMPTRLRPGTGAELDMRKWRVIVFPAHTHHPQAADDTAAMRNSTAREMTGLNRNGQN